MTQSADFAAMNERSTKCVAKARDGAVVVRSIGSDLRMDYTAVGQTTHLSARMEQLAPPGAIRITAETLRLVEGFVEVRPLGAVPVKGLAAPVALMLCPRCHNAVLWPY